MTENLRAPALAAKNATCFDDLQDAIDAIDAMDHMTTPDAVLALLDEMDRLKAEIADHERAYELLFKECGELRKDAERDSKADMYWNSDDADRPHDSIGCFLNDQICQHDLEVGAEFTIWRAKKLPSVKIRVTAIDDEECEAEYEVIDSAAKGESHE